MLTRPVTSQDPIVWHPSVHGCNPVRSYCEGIAVVYTCSSCEGCLTYTILKHLHYSALSLGTCEGFLGYILAVQYSSSQSPLSRGP